MEEVDVVSGKSSSDTACSGCNYQTSSVQEETDATSVSPGDRYHSSTMLPQHQNQAHPHLHAHPLLSEQGRILPPQYDGRLTSINNNNNNNNNSSSSSSYSLTGADHSDNTKYHHQHYLFGGQVHPYQYHGRYQQPHCQLDYCNAVSYGRRHQLDLAAGEPRPLAGSYWPDQQQQAPHPGDMDDEQTDVKPTLLDASSYLLPAGSYPARQHCYLPRWYQTSAGTYGWNMAAGGDPIGGGYYRGSSAYSDAQQTSTPMHHILRGVYNTLQVLSLIHI